ncbi:MAG: formyltransferase [Burkholderiales bacterium]
MASAVVFAYHNVGVRCLQVLLSRDFDVRLVVTHEDVPGENIWFASVKNLAAELGLAVLTPDDPNCDEVVERVRAAQPDFLFSFYYRRMLSPSLLQSPLRGAYNMHGSLLPKYRGRAPVNWAVIKGETETGATLHVMADMPDAGAIVDQTAVPILPNDTAREVFDKVVVAAEMTLSHCLPALLDKRATFKAQDLSKGAYFGGRRPEDGRIDWALPTFDIHNLVRGVTRPYPGAFSDTALGRLVLWRTVLLPARDPGLPTLILHDKQIVARCADGGLLRILDAELIGRALTPAMLPVALT